MFSSVWFAYLDEDVRLVSHQILVEDILQVLKLRTLLQTLNSF